MKPASPQAREHMLSRIRKALEAAEDDAERRFAVQKRLHNPPDHVVPEQARAAGEARLALFKEKAKGQGMTVAEARQAADVPELIAEFLRAGNLGTSLAMGFDPWLATLPWGRAPHLQRRTGKAEAADEVSLSRAFAAAAETGTLVLTSGRDNPTTLNFLPETHIVVLEASALAAGYEEIWSRLEALHGHRELPRTVNFISGPSRTADIEQTIVMGAHGPRRVHVILVGGAGETMDKLRLERAKG